jgi:hypothetical protein
MDRYCWFVFIPHVFGVMVEADDFALLASDKVVVVCADVVCNAGNVSSEIKKHLPGQGAVIRGVQRFNAFQ